MADQNRRTGGRSRNRGATGVSALNSATAARARSAAVYSGLRRAIIEQSLVPGTKLPEDAIGDSFAVSRTLVREALARLASEGLVEQIKNRGSFVASPSLAEALQVFDVRRQLERLVVKRLAGALNDLQIKRLRTHVASERRLLGKSVPEAIRLAGEFHVLLSEFTGNAVLARYVSEVVSRCSLILALYSRPHSAECGASEHLQIIEALKEGDAAKARGLMDHHLNAVQARALIPVAATGERGLNDVLATYAAQATPLAAPKRHSTVLAAER